MSNNSLLHYFFRFLNWSSLSVTTQHDSVFQGWDRFCHYAMTRGDLLAGRITESPVQNQIRRSFHPTRSGNIHMVPEQYWFLHSTEEAEKKGIK